MFNSNILDLAITLCFIYFLLALMVSTINEILNAFTKARSKYLITAIENMFFDSSWKNISIQILKNPFIQSLQKKENLFPSYIPARNFALAVADIISAGSQDRFDLQSFRLTLTNDTNKLKGDAQKVLISLLNDADDDYNKFISNIERFYDDSMERVSGWFRKYNRKLLMGISFAVVIILNVDTIHICDSLWKDQGKLKEASDLAIEYARGKDTLSEKIISIKNDTTKSDTLLRRIVSSTGNIKQIEVKLKELPIPLGWSESNYPSGDKSCLTKWIVKAGGWLITTLAIFLGAPFWFDLLNKFVNLRAAGRKPKRENETSEK